MRLGPLRILVLDVLRTGQNGDVSRSQNVVSLAWLTSTT